MVKIRVLLADQRVIGREALRFVLDADGRFEVVAETVDCARAIDLGALLDVHVMVLSLHGNDLTARNDLERFREANSSSRILVLVTHPDPGYLRSLVDAGVSGFVHEQSSLGSVVEAIETIAAGGSYIDTAIAQRVSAKLRRDAGTMTPSRLSVREKHVATLVSRGYTHKDIALQLGLSVKSVDTYRQRAMEKLGLSRRPELVAYAITQGWLGIR